MAPIEERFSDSSGMPPAPRHDALRRDGAGPVRSHAEHGNEEARKSMPRILPGLPNVYKNTAYLGAQHIYAVGLLNKAVKYFLHLRLI